MSSVHGLVRVCKKHLVLIHLEAHRTPHPARWTTTLSHESTCLNAINMRALIDLGGVPREQKILKGTLTQIHIFGPSCNRTNYSRNRSKYFFLKRNVSISRIIIY